MKDTERISVQVPAGLADRARDVCAAMGVPFSRLVTMAVDAEVARLEAMYRAEHHGDPLPRRVAPIRRGRPSRRS